MSGQQWPGTPVDVTPTTGVLPPRPVITLPNTHQDRQDANNATQTTIAVGKDVRDTADWQARHFPDGTLRPNAGQVDKIPDSGVTAIQGNLASLRNVNDALTLFDKHPHAVGWTTGALGDKFTQWNDPDGIETRAAISKVGAYKIHDLSGAAVSLSEAPRFSPFVPTVSDSPEAARKKLINLRRELRATANEQLGFFTPDNGYMPYKGPGIEEAVNGGPSDQAQPKNADAAPVAGNSGTPPNPFEGLPAASSGTPGLYDANGNFIGQDPRAVDQPRQADGTYRDAQGVLHSPDGGEILEGEVHGGDAPELSKYEADLKAALEQQGVGDPTAYQNWLMRAANGTMFGLSDEFNGSVYGLKALLQGLNPVVAYKVARDLEQMRQHQNKEGQGWTGTALEVAASLPTAAAFPMGEGAGGAAKAGAGMGAVQGFGNGNGMGDSVRSAVTGAGLGAVVGAGVQAAAPYVAAGARKLLSREAVPTSEGAQVIGAADRLNTLTGSDIAPIPADVSGPGIRNLTSGMAKMPLSAHSIVKGGEKVSTEAQAARDYIAKLAGNPAELEAAGESALNGAQSYIKRSRTKVGSLYSKAKALGGDTPVDLANARAALDEHIAELSQTPGGAPGLDTLKALRAEMDAAYPVEGIKRMRTALRDKFSSDGLRGSDIERRVGQVVDAADIDVADSLTAAGKGSAAKAYAEAAAAHKERIGVIDSVIAPIIGRKGDAPLSGETIMANIAGLTKRNNAGLGRFLSSIPEADAATIRATLISRLGRASSGTQNAEGSAFTLPQFLTHWNDMTPAAKSTLFGGQLRAALDDLATVAGGTKGAQKYANFSNTGSPLGLVGTSGVAGAGYAHPFLAISALAAQFGGGKLLASPAFARWLARMPKDAPKIIEHIGQLSRLAASNPVIATEARDLQRQLVASFASGPTSLAAEPGQDRNEAKPTTIPAPR